MTEKCRKCVNTVQKFLTVQHLTMFISPFSCCRALSFLSAHPRNFASWCLLLGDSVLKGGASHKASQAAITFSLFEGVQEGPAVSAFERPPLDWLLQLDINSLGVGVFNAFLVYLTEFNIMFTKEELKPKQQKDRQVQTTNKDFQDFKIDKHWSITGN